MKRLLAIGLILLLSLTEANACQCTELPKLTREFAETYDLIFVGEVIAISPGDVQSTARFRIKSLYRGQAYMHVDVQYDNEGDCGLNFMPGETWTVYGKWTEYNIQDRVGVARADWCMHTRKQMNAGEQDYYMTGGRHSYEDELKLLNDSLGVQPFLDPTETKNQLHTNELPGAGTAIGYLVAGLLGLAIIFFFVRRMFKRDGK